MKKVFIISGVVILILGLCIFFYVQFIVPGELANQEIELGLSHLESDAEAVVEEREEEQVSKNEEKIQEKKGGVVYIVPYMDKVDVTKDISYKVDKDNELKLDIYHPLNEKSDSKGYPVILIHGKTSDRNFKDTEYFTSWGRLVAASGFTAITFNWRSGIEPSDISDLIAYVREHANELDIVDSGMSIIAFSMGVEDGVKETLSMNTGFVDSIVTYYGRVPVAILEDFSKTDIPPMVIAKAAHDQYFPIDCNDEFIEKARSLGIEIIEILHSEGAHGFDLYNDDEQTYEIIRKSLEFIKIKSKI